MSSYCPSFVENAWRRNICSNCFRLKEDHDTKPLQNDTKYLESGKLESDANPSSKILDSSNHLSSNEPNFALSSPLQVQVDKVFFTHDSSTVPATSIPRLQVCQASSAKLVPENERGHPVISSLGSSYLQKYKASCCKETFKEQPFVMTKSVQRLSIAPSFKDPYDKNLKICSNIFGKDSCLLTNSIGRTDEEGVQLLRNSSHIQSRQSRSHCGERRASDHVQSDRNDYCDDSHPNCNDDVKKEHKEGNYHIDDCGGTSPNNDGVKTGKNKIREFPWKGSSWKDRFGLDMDSADCSNRSENVEGRWAISRNGASITGCGAWSPAIANDKGTNKRACDTARNGSFVLSEEEQPDRSQLASDCGEVKTCLAKERSCSSNKLFSAREIFELPSCVSDGVPLTKNASNGLESGENVSSNLNVNSKVKKLREAAISSPYAKNWISSKHWSKELCAKSHHFNDGQLVGGVKKCKNELEVIEKSVEKGLLLCVESEEPDGGTQSRLKKLTVNEVKMSSATSMRNHHHAGLNHKGGGHHGSERLKTHNMATTKCLASKGILKSKDKMKRKFSVSFPKEVHEVIGYGGELESDFSEEEEIPNDPHDDSSISHILEKFSITQEEREIHKETKKNTSFNTIKTNLLGTTCIEIGPIVGCTGGKSLQNNAKPLVLIGTFDSRKEPLKINAKIGADSPDGNALLIQQQRRFTPKVPHNSDASVNEESRKKIDTCNIEKSEKIVVSSNSSVLKVADVKLGSGQKLNEVKPPVTKIPCPLRTSDSSTTNSPKLGDCNDAEKSTVTYKTVDPIRTSNKLNAMIEGSSHVPGKASIASGRSHENIATSKVVRPSETSSSEKNGVEAKHSENFRGNVHIKGLNVKTRVALLTSNHNNVKPAVKTEKPNRTKPFLTKQAQVTKREEPSCINNLIIMTEANRITTKKTAFLKSMTNDTELVTGPMDTDSLEMLPDAVATPRSFNPIVMKEEKRDTDPTISLGSEYHFDDSLEDSGIDTGKSNKDKGNGSDSDEKCSSSSSDSGNEQDYSDRLKSKGHVKYNGPQPSATVFDDKDSTEDGSKKTYMESKDKDANSKGLFISVHDLNEKPAKLSPDSVIYSASSNSSGSGSSESIPDQCTTTNADRNAVNAGVDSTRQKKLAPPPPPPPSLMKNEQQPIYANEGREAPQNCEEESLYDDVGNCRINIDPDGTNPNDEEAIYDDAIALRTNEKGVTGSYDLQDGANVSLDEDECLDELVNLNSNGGIEFIGIRKIDSETFIRERSRSPELQLSRNKCNRPSSASPKPRRKVNHFFSTIGKKAGAALSSASSSYASSTTKALNKIRSIDSSSTTNYSPDPSTHYSKRSLSTDEVNSTRTQEIYATLTPTSLKFKGLAPVLSKLSKIDVALNDKSSSSKEQTDPSSEKLFKKKKISNSIKKFLKIGVNNRTSSVENYDIYSENDMPSSHDGAKGPKRLPTSKLSSSSSSSSTSEEPFSIASTGVSETDSNLIASSETSTASSKQESRGNKNNINRIPPSKPPPPPPRVHSLDLLNKVGLIGPQGVVRPSRPPPPVRTNKVAPTFVSVFSTPELQENPPCKPLRKSSMIGGTKDLESNYNHITNLNLETLKLVANQTTAKIECYARSRKLLKLSNFKPKWTDFEILLSPRLPYGEGFAFYGAKWEDEPCILFLQEQTTVPDFTAPFTIDCVQTIATFDEKVPVEFVAWEPSEDLMSIDGNVKVFVTILPEFEVEFLHDFIASDKVLVEDKYLALLQSMELRDKEEMSNLLVLYQKPENQTDCSLDLLYALPKPRLHGQGEKSVSKLHLQTEFEISMKQVLLMPREHGSLLTERDKEILLRKTSGTMHNVKDELMLFLQLKLFGPKTDSSDIIKISKMKSERSVQQWLDRERALCMKEAVERTILKNPKPMTPFKKAYIDFLMGSGNCAKSVLAMLFELMDLTDAQACGGNT